MLKQLLKKLQQREFSAEQEEILNAEMQEVQQALEENKRLRAFEDSVRAEINKDGEKVKKFNDLDTKIESLQKKHQKIESASVALAILMTFVTIATSIGFTILGFNLVSNFVLQCLFPFLSLPVCCGIAYPIVNKMSKTSVDTEEQLGELYAEKTNLLDEVYKSIEKTSPVSFEDIKSFKRFKGGDFSVKVSATDDNITTV